MRHKDQWGARPPGGQHFHAIQDILATPKELTVLSAEDGRLREIIARDFRLSPEEAAQMSKIEVQAHAYDSWLQGGMKEAGGAIKQFFGKVKEFFRRLANGLHGIGFKTSEDVFQDATAGTMAGREPAEVGQMYRNLAGYPNELASIASPTGGQDVAS